MKKIIIILTLFTLPLFFWQCGSTESTDSTDSTKSEDTSQMIAQNQSQTQEAATVSSTVVKKISDALVSKFGKENAVLIQKGVQHVARLWQSSDGTAAQLEDFCKKYFIASEKEREQVFKKLSRNFEVLYGHFNKITLDLREPLDLPGGAIHPIDQMFGGYNVSTHLDEDFYRNKVAFIIALNFPFYSLEEKKELGPDWSRQEWAYARMGDFYISRVPPSLRQNYSQINTDSSIYISQYNIYMGSLLNDKGEKLFPKNLVLLTHWNLRDELKSKYNVSGGLKKQEMVYEVMKRIISQEIPGEVINSGDLDWNPLQNKVYKEGKEIEFKPEPDTRYQHMLNNFRALRAMDGHYPPALNTYIKRNFDGQMEISQSEVEALFIQFISSPQVKQVAQLIGKRLGRDLRAFDIWYNGFKPSNIPEEKLDQITKKKYPTPGALEKDLPNILLKLGFSKEKTASLAAKVVVDPARGSGHAWGAQMREEKAHLRTRIAQDGMDYKGYNIAVHEFGHNVEQTISLQDVDYYMMSGVPNTSFTEALAFMFQKRDIELLGLKESDPNKQHLITLDTFWNVYESMGVSLVDMYAWKWMYENPEATPGQLKQAIIGIAKDVWNKYYADALGSKDSPLLAIYSHMISYPLYLSAYSYGYLIDFQVEQYIRDKDFASEVERMFSLGRLIPQLWMKEAVNNEISIEPFLQSTDEALKVVTQ